MLKRKSKKEKERKEQQREQWAREQQQAREQKELENQLLADAVARTTSPPVQSPASSSGGGMARTMSPPMMSGTSSPGPSITAAITSTGPNGPNNAGMPRPNGPNGPNAVGRAAGGGQPLNSPGTGPNKGRPPSYPWSIRQLQHLTPFPRCDYALCSVGPQEMCLFGGLCKEGPQNDVYLIDTQSLIVTPVQVEGDIPMPRDGHTAVCSSHWVVIFGGESDDGKCEDSLYALNLETRHWMRVNVQGNIPMRRRDHTAVMANGVMFIFGGQSDGYFFNDLMAFDTRTLTAPVPRWEFYEPANDGPSGRAGHSTTVYQDRLYVFGGTDGETFFNEMWCYDLHTCVWELLNVTGHTPPGRAGHAAALVDDCIYVTGGKSATGKNLSDVVAFRIRTMRWYTFQRMGPAPTSRSGHSMCVFGSRVYVLSGEAREGEDPAAIHVLEAGKIRYPAAPPLQPRIPANPDGPHQYPTRPPQSVNMPSSLPSPSPMHNDPMSHGGNNMPQTSQQQLPPGVSHIMSPTQRSTPPPQPPPTSTSSASSISMNHQRRISTDQHNGHIMSPPIRQGASPQSHNQAGAAAAAQRWPNVPGSNSSSVVGSPMDYRPTSRTDSPAIPSPSSYTHHQSNGSISGSVNGSSYRSNDPHSNMATSHSGMNHQQQQQQQHLQDIPDPVVSRARQDTFGHEADLPDVLRNDADRSETERLHSPGQPTNYHNGAVANNATASTSTMNEKEHYQSSPPHSSATTSPPRSYNQYNSTAAATTTTASHGSTTEVAGGDTHNNNYHPPNSNSSNHSAQYSNNANANRARSDSQSSISKGHATPEDVYHRRVTQTNESQPPASSASSRSNTSAYTTAAGNAINHANQYRASPNHEKTASQSTTTRHLDLDTDLELPEPIPRIELDQVDKYDKYDRSSTVDGSQMSNDDQHSMMMLTADDDDDDDDDDDEEDNNDNGGRDRQLHLQHGHMNNTHGSYNRQDAYYDDMLDPETPTSASQGLRSPMSPSYRKQGSLLSHRKEKRSSRIGVNGAGASNPYGGTHYNHGGGMSAGGGKMARRRSKRLSTHRQSTGPSLTMIVDKLRTKRQEIESRYQQDSPLDDTSRDGGFNHRPVHYRTDSNNAGGALHQKRHEEILRGPVELASGSLASLIATNEIPVLPAFATDLEADANFQAELGPFDGPRHTLYRSFIQLAKELQQAKMAIAESAREAAERVREAEKIKQSALHETAYLKAKMAALSNGSTRELTRIGEERAADLDRKLTAALADNDRLRTELLERDRVAPRDAELRRRATESAEEAANRIRELERLHAEARDQAAKAREELAQATAASRDAVSRSLAADQATANKNSKLEELERQLEQHRRAADAAAQAVRSANARADESERMWQQTEERVSGLESELDEVRGELQAKSAELERQRTRTSDMERMWRSARNQVTELESIRDMFGDISSAKSTPPGSSRSAGAGDNSNSNNGNTAHNGTSDEHRRDLEQQVQSYKMSVEQLNEAIRQSEKTRQDTEHRAVQAEKLYAKAQSELAAFRRRSVFRHDQQANMSAELAAFESRIRAKQAECDEAQARASALLALMNDSPPRGMDADTRTLVDRLIQLEREREQYESSMSSLRADLSRLQHERTGFI